MHFRILTAFAVIMVTAATTCAQTGPIQKKVEEKLDKARKDQAALEDLLAQALKTNADIRVAEAKLREAEAEVYRARMKIFHRIVVLNEELKNARVRMNALQEAVDHHEKLFKKGLASKVTFDDFTAKLQEVKMEVARAEAEMDLLCGKAQKDGTPSATAKALEWLARTQIADAKWQTDWQNLLDPARKTLRPDDLVARSSPTAVPESMADKLRKALDSTIKLDLQSVRTDEVIETLRNHTKGVNVHSRIVNTDAVESLLLKEPVPLGAVYQWAEDNFDWRFIIRDYGIVATDRKSVPPGATLLMDFWRKRPETAAP
jgi:hypothetical protein